MVRVGRWRWAGLVVTVMTGVALIAWEARLAPGHERTADWVADDEPAAVTNLRRAVPTTRFVGQGLSEVLDALARATGVRLEADWRALEACGITRDAPVVVKLGAGGSLDEALAAVLADLEAESFPAPIAPGSLVHGPGAGAWW